MSAVKTALARLRANGTPLAALDGAADVAATVQVGLPEMCAVAEVTPAAAAAPAP